MFELAIVVLSQMASNADAPMRDRCAARASAAANSWERVKEPALGPYCDLLANATSKLSAKPPALPSALKALDAAERVLPHQVSTLLLRGRALAMAGDFTAAYETFRDAKERAPNLADDSHALLWFARASVATGHAADALDVYRVLLMRTSSLSSPERGQVPLEAGFLAMGEGDLPEAIRCFRAAEKDTADIDHVLAEIGSAIAVDRTGTTKAALNDETARRFLAATPQQLGWLPAGERDAWRAFVLDARRLPEANDIWKRVASAGGRYAAYAASKVRPR